MRATCILTGALLVAGLAAGPGWCAAADGTDPLATEALRSRLEHRSLARVTGPWGAVRLTDPRVTAAGLEFLAARPDEPTAGSAAAVPKPIPLAQVYEVEIRVNSAGLMAIVGGLVGAAIGMTVTQAMSQIMGPNPPPSSRELMTGTMLGAVPGTLLGAIVGSAFRHWKTVYPKTSHPEDPPLELNSR